MTDEKILATAKLERLFLGSAMTTAPSFSPPNLRVRKEYIDIKCLEVLKRYDQAMDLSRQVEPMHTLLQNGNKIKEFISCYAWLPTHFLIWQLWTAGWYTQETKQTKTNQLRTHFIYCMSIAEVETRKAILGKLNCFSWVCLKVSRRSRLICSRSHASRSHARVKQPDANWLSVSAWLQRGTVNTWPLTFLLLCYCELMMINNYSNIFVFWLCICFVALECLTSTCFCDSHLTKCLVLWVLFIFW